MIKAKIDTNARTTALHAFEMRPTTDSALQRVEFKIHPRQGDNGTIVVCTVGVTSELMVSDSGGPREQRRAIETALSLGSHNWLIEITLTARDDIRFRILPGTTAVPGRADANPAFSCLVGKRIRKRKDTRCQKVQTKQ